MSKKILIPPMSMVLLNIGIENSTNTRIRDNNKKVGDFYTGPLKLNSKWSLHSYRLVRKLNFIKVDLQNPYRIGSKYQLHTQVQVRLGDAFINSFLKENYLSNSYGKSANERSLYQMVMGTDNKDKIESCYQIKLLNQVRKWILKNFHFNKGFIINLSLISYFHY